MLNSAGDAERDVQLRRDDFARLTDLQRVVRIAGVDSRTRRTNGGTEDVSERVERLLERLRILERAAARHDAGRRAEFGAVGFGEVDSDVLRRGVGDGDGVEGLEFGRGGRVGGGGGEGGGTHGEEFDGDGRGGADGGDGVAGVDGASECGAVGGGVVGEGRDV